jgi:hypothetical protein
MPMLIAVHSPCRRSEDTTLPRSRGSAFLRKKAPASNSTNLARLQSWTPHPYHPPTFSVTTRAYSESCAILALGRQPRIAASRALVSMICSSSHTNYSAVWPPSATKAAPVIKLASSERRKSATCAMSFGSPTRPIGRSVLTSPRLLML